MQARCFEKDSTSRAAFGLRSDENCDARGAERLLALPRGLAETLQLTDRQSHGQRRRGYCRQQLSGCTRACGGRKTSRNPSDRGGPRSTPERTPLGENGLHHRISPITEHYLTEIGPVLASSVLRQPVQCQVAIMGAAGRKRVEDGYSLRAVAPKLIHSLKSFGGSRDNTVVAIVR